MTGQLSEVSLVFSGSPCLHGGLFLYPWFAVTAGEGEFAKSLVGSEEFENSRGVFWGGVYCDFLAALTGDTEFETGVREGGSDTPGSAAAATLVNDSGRDAFDERDALKDRDDERRCFGESGVSTTAEILGHVL